MQKKPQPTKLSTSLMRAGHVVHYISATTGAGKSHYFIEEAKKENERNVNVMIIVPTIELANELMNRGGPRFRAIHSGNTGNAIAKIVEAITVPTVTGTLIVTDAAFRLIPKHVRDTFLNRWVGFKDEAIEPLAIEEFFIPDSWHEVFSTWFHLKSVEDQVSLDLYTEITGKAAPVNSSARLYAALGVSENCPKTTTIQDTIYGKLHALKQHILDPDVEVIVNLSVLDESFRANREDDTVPIRMTYSLFDNPTLYSCFKRVTLAGANWEDSFIYHQWKNRGVHWDDVTPRNLLRTIPSKRVSIHYYFADEGARWSAAFRNRKNAAGDINGQMYIDWVNKQVKTTPIIYSKNNSCALQYPESNSWTKLPGVSHGLNKWSHFSVYASFASYLTANHVEPFFRYYGTSISDTNALRSIQSIFQAAARGDLRNHKSTKPYDIYVATLGEALQLLMYLPEARIRNYGKKRDGEKTGTSVTLKTNWRDGKAATALDTPPDTARYTFGAHSTDYKSKRNYDFGWKFTDENTHPIIQIVQACVGGSVKGKNAAEIDEHKANNLPFFTMGDIPRDKRFLEENVVSASDFLAFDFDDTVLTEKQLSQIFVGKFCTYTTISHKPGKKTSRFRVVLPLNRTISKYEHGKLMDYFTERIQSYEKRSKQPAGTGFDSKCVKLERKFFLSHEESKVEYVWRKRQNTDVDLIMLQIPLAPLTLSPTVRDLLIVNENDTPTTSIVDDPEYQKRGAALVKERIEAALSSMGPGDRSHKAVQIGGLLGVLKNEDVYKERVISQLEMNGVDPSAIRQAKRYGKMGLYR